jgi:hypothetical protein
MVYYSSILTYDRNYFNTNLKLITMKIKHLPWILSSAAIVLFSSFALLYPGGAPTSVTGSPGDGANCTKCHGGTATTTAGLITSNIPLAGYVAGQTYQITVTNNLAGSGKYGFELSPQNAAGTQLGTLVAGTGSELVSGGTKYVTQSNASSTTSSWTFSWIAPPVGTGQVTFYGAMAKNYPGPTTLSTLTVQEAVNTGRAEENPASIKVIAGEQNGFIDVELNTNANHAKIAVFDLSGRQLLSTSVSGNGSHQLDKKFKTGVYIVIVQADGAMLKKKIMVL